MNNKHLRIKIVLTSFETKELEVVLDHIRGELDKCVVRLLCPFKKARCDRRRQ